MSGDTQVLDGVAEAYRSRRERVFEAADELARALAAVESPVGDSGAAEVDPGLVAEASESVLRDFDEERGGFGHAPKFPNTLLLELWLRRGAGRDGAGWVERAHRSFRAMAEGGINDQLGGGFHRYSTDERWLIPHFEKMLYDNALILRLGTQLFLATRDREIERVLQETGDWMLREMRDAAGGFYSSQDADSEGEEGRFFVWDPTELERVLDKRDATLFARVFGVDDGGNFQSGRSVLHRRMPVAQAAALEGRDVNEAMSALGHARAKLFEARERRERPATDDKILAGWNGLAIQGLALTGAALGIPRFVQAARACSEFVTREMIRDGGLQRSWWHGRATQDAFAEDYAFLAEGELALFSATGHPAHFERARSFVEEALERFEDPAGGLFLARSDDEKLPARPHATLDGAVPSATSSFAMALALLATLTGDDRYRTIAQRALLRLAPAMARHPFGFGYALCAVDAVSSGVATLIITGAGELLAAARHLFAPRLFVLPATGEPLPPALAPLLAGKPADDGRTQEPKAYLCRGGTCWPPVDTVPALERLLAFAR